jgi:hypothetical protein
MTLQEIQTALVLLADAPGVRVNGVFALTGNVVVDGEEIIVTDVHGRTLRLAPEDIKMLGRASASDVRLAEVCGGNR